MLTPGRIAAISVRSAVNDIVQWVESHSYCVVLSDLIIIRYPGVHDGLMGTASITVEKQKTMTIAVVMQWNPSDGVLEVVTKLFGGSSEISNGEQLDRYVD